MAVPNVIRGRCDPRGRPGSSAHQRCPVQSRRAGCPGTAGPQQTREPPPSTEGRTRLPTMEAAAARGAGGQGSCAAGPQGTHAGRDRTAGLVAILGGKPAP